MAIAAAKKSPAVTDEPATGAIAINESDGRLDLTRSTIKNSAAPARVEWTI